MERQTRFDCLGSPIFFQTVYYVYCDSLCISEHLIIIGEAVDRWAGH